MQRLLNAAVWDAEEVRDDLRAYVIEHLGDAESGVLVIDETGFPKKGDASCGVAPQYCGTTGHTTNCQVGVFLGYASRHGMAFLERGLYLPRVWTDDRTRRHAAGVPEDVGFATKVALAKQMLARVFAAKVSARWRVADSFYGRAHHFRQWLKDQGQPQVVGVLPTQVVETANGVVCAPVPTFSPRAWGWTAADAMTGGRRGRSAALPLLEVVVVDDGNAGIARAMEALVEAWARREAAARPAGKADQATGERAYDRVRNSASIL